MKERAKTLIDLIEGARFLFAERPLPMEEKATGILDADNGAGRAVVAGLIPALEAVDDWDVADVETAVREYTEQQGLKLGKVAQPIRAATTGRTTSPGVFDVMAVLGKDECLARLRDQAR